MKPLQNLIFLLASLLILGACKKDPETGLKLVDNDYKTENVVIIVVDGPRFQETWGHPDKKYIPYLADSFTPLGVYNRSFFNFGRTKTIPGHTAISTGVYEDLNNSGLQYPSYPSLLQYFLKAEKLPPEKAWFVTSKEKLDVLANTSNLDWRGNYRPMVDAVDRSDQKTYYRILEIFKEHKPRMMMVNFRHPDVYGHWQNWPGYLRGIQETDSLSWLIYQHIQQDPFYKDNTTFIITNDHGRHHDDISVGFYSHGDQCSGCTHINFFATGPDFKKDVIINQQREQVDILPTLAHILGFSTLQTDGEIMTELLKDE